MTVSVEETPTNFDAPSWEPAAAGIWHAFLTDLARYHDYYQPGRSALTLMLLNQGLCAFLQFRVAHALHECRLPRFMKKPLLVTCLLWQKSVEVLTGIELPYQARVAPGLYIGHLGCIIIHPDGVIGAGCNLSQGVTLGVSGRGHRRGVPVLGDRVYVGANAVIAGSISVGGDALVAANALVTRDAAPNAVVLGNPASVFRFERSGEYLSPHYAPA